MSMENTINPKKGRIQLNTDEIIIDYNKVVQNTLNMVSFIMTNLQETEFDIVPNPPLFNHFKLVEIQYVGDKKIYLNMWIFNHALNDIIKAINLSLGRANYFSELMELNGKTFSIEDYEKHEKKLNKKYLKRDMPSLITGIEQKLTKPLIHLEYIKSINDVRKCLEHRAGIVTEIDTNTEVESKNVLMMKWMAQEISVIRKGERIVIDKPFT